MTHILPAMVIFVPIICCGCFCCASVPFTIYSDFMEKEERAEEERMRTQERLRIIWMQQLLIQLRHQHSNHRNKLVVVTSTVAMEEKEKQVEMKPKRRRRGRSRKVDGDNNGSNERSQSLSLTSDDDDDALDRAAHDILEMMEEKEQNHGENEKNLKIPKFDDDYWPRVMKANSRRKFTKYCVMMICSIFLATVCDLLSFWSFAMMSEFYRSQRWRHSITYVAKAQYCGEREKEGAVVWKWEKFGWQEWAIVAAWMWG